LALFREAERIEEAPAREQGTALQEPRTVAARRLAHPELTHVSRPDDLLVDGPRSLE
jgi:hypothetical protein